MPTMTIAEMLVQEKQRERARVEEVIGVLENALSTMRTWAKNTGSTGKPRKTQLQMAAAVLREHGKPMHAEAIRERIMDKFDFSAKKGNLGTMLYRCAVKAPKTCIFYKVADAENTYGLKEWRK